MTWGRPRRRRNATSGANRNPEFRNSDFVRSPIRTSDGQRLNVSDKFGQLLSRNGREKFLKNNVFKLSKTILNVFFCISFYNDQIIMISYLVSIVYSGTVFNNNRTNFGQINTSDSFGRTADTVFGPRTDSGHIFSETGPTSSYTVS